MNLEVTLNGLFEDKKLLCLGHEQEDGRLQFDSDCSQCKISG